MNFWSVTASGGFSESEISHRTGTRAKISTSAIAMPQSALSRPARSISAPRPPFVQTRAQALDEEEGDDEDTEEDQHRDGRSEAEVEARDQLVVAEDRDRFGVLGTAGHDEDRVED